METDDAAEEGQPILVDPDLAFIRELGLQAGGTFKKCFQCGTCSGTCALFPEREAFPRKEMAWATWGLKERLLSDPDVWLCHQCHDCSVHCPRGANPGDVLSALRAECVTHHATPRTLARWVNRPKFIPLLLAIPAVLLSLALTVRDPIARALDLPLNTGDRIVFPYSRGLPHWLLNTFFLFFAFLALLALASGVRRFWSAMKAAGANEGRTEPVKALGQGIRSTLRTIFLQEKFTQCTQERPRYWSHFLVFYGFLGLTLVGLWVATVKINPLLGDGFVYPFNFWSPWKMLANLGGVAVLVGGMWMVVTRVLRDQAGGHSCYSDWFLLATLVLVVLSGLASEVLHYIRLEPHRHAVYFVHLLLVFALLVYLPYSKLAHVAYRTAAMVYAECYGRPEGGDDNGANR